jgi:hypothetical protein
MPHCNAAHLVILVAQPRLLALLQPCQLVQQVQVLLQALGQLHGVDAHLQGSGA